MGAPTVTNTFSNGTTADATAVNQNFIDLIAAMSNGASDFSIGALTVAGALAANGAVTLGNATGDDVTVTGYLASAVIPKTDDTYDLGTAALKWRDIYIDGVAYADSVVIAGGSALTNYTTWATFTPAFTKNAGSGTLTSVNVLNARWCQIGKIVHVICNIDTITVATDTITLKFTLPIASSNTIRVPAYAYTGSAYASAVSLFISSNTTALISNVSWSVGSASEFGCIFSYEVA